MRDRRTPPQALLFLLMAIMAAATMTARAADDDYYDEYDVTARVARISLLRGDASLRRAGSNKWERATLNLPLVEGDTLATGLNSRIEIQIDAYNFVRLDADSVLRIITLHDEGVALSLTEGTATVRLARFDRDKEYFEVDAPKTTMAAEQRGLYRLDVARNRDGVRLTVRDGGRARIYSETSGFTLRDGRSAELVFDGADAGDWELSSARDFDEWDRWVDDRERYLAARLRYEQRDRYYDREVWGAEELDVYGSWTYVNDYGWIWRPHATVINVYNNWAPYRYGKWRWCPPYGWTWVGDEPWGWAPYHYGRWVYHNNSWCWAPRGYGYKYRRSYWRPALVAFVYVPTHRGEHVAWYPLTYGQRDPHARYFRQQRPERLTPLRSNEIANLQRTNPIYQRAVTTLPAREFGQQAARTQAAPVEIARRAVTSEPVIGRLPIRPAEADANNQALPANRRARAGVVARDDTSVAPARPLLERATGAATRRPGVPLDNELRRARIFNGREPRPAATGEIRSSDGAAAGSAGPERSAGSELRDTGAVARPARPRATLPVERRVEPGINSNETGASPVMRPARPRIPKSDEDRLPVRTGNESPETGEPGRIIRNDNDSAPREERRARPARPFPKEDRPPSAGDNEQPEPRERRPARIERPQPEPPAPQPEQTAPPPEERHERPARPERREQPERFERPAQPERQERPERPEREERPARQERVERPERQESPPERQERVERPEPQESPPPQRVERPERHENPAPQPRVERPERQEQQPERQESRPPAESPRPAAPQREERDERPARPARPKDDEP